MSLYSKGEMVDVAKRAELWMWSGCPSELLEILWTINSVSLDEASAPIDDVSAIFNRLSKFSPSEWANSHHEGGPVVERNHIASAYQGAVEIYARRLFNQPWQEMSVTDDIVDATIAHLIAIHPTDTHFKGIVWPAFIAGAEARTLSQRAITRRMFEDLSNFLHTWNVKRVIPTLERIWARTPADSVKQSWVHYLREAGDDLLLL